MMVGWGEGGRSRRRSACDQVVGLWCSRYAVALQSGEWVVSSVSGSRSTARQMGNDASCIFSSKGCHQVSPLRLTGDRETSCELGRDRQRPWYGAPGSLFANHPADGPRSDRGVGVQVQVQGSSEHGLCSQLNNCSVFVVLCNMATPTLSVRSVSFHGW